MAKGGARSGDRGSMVGQGGKIVGQASDGGSHPVVAHQSVIPTPKASQAGSNSKGLPPGRTGNGIPPKVDGSATGSKKGRPPGFKGEKK